MYVNDYAVRFKERLLNNAKYAEESGATRLHSVAMLLVDWIDRSTKFMLEGSGLSICSSESPEAGIDIPASLPSLLVNPFPISFIQWNRLKKHHDTELTGLLIIDIDEKIFAECQAHDFMSFGRKNGQSSDRSFPADALGGILTIAISGHGDYVVPTMGYFFHPADVQVIKMKVSRDIRKLLAAEAGSGRTINESIVKLLNAPELDAMDSEPEVITKGRGNGIIDNGRFVLLSAEYIPEVLERYGQGDAVLGLQQSAHVAQAMAMFAMDFMAVVNCSNVVVMTNVPPDKMNVKRLRNGRLPFSEFKTLVINDAPTKEYADDDDVDPESTGIHQRQHVRRAHIRVLCGGRNVYVRACVAGRAELGTIRKNYLVQQPA